MTTFTDKPWNGSASRFTDEQYKSSCLICEPQCDGTPKKCCHLPVKEPGGAVNKNALSSALGALHGSRTPMKISSELKNKAMNKLKSLYKQAGMEMKAKSSDNKFTPDGIIWSSGKHNIYVNGQPSTVYVPQETILPTYQRLKAKGEVPLGIDHLSDDVLRNNEILAKMNLLDVGRGYDFGTDGENIYLLKGEINNPLIHDLGLTGELPSYSSVGRFKSTECERNDVDYVLTELDIDRVDFVEAGGCRICKVGAQPDELILTSKLVEVKNMTKEEKIEKTTEEKVVEAQSTDTTTEDTELQDVKEQLKTLSAALADVTSQLEARKKAEEEKVIAAKKAEIDTKVEGIIEAGKATPVEKEALMELAEKDMELFDKLMAAKPKILKFEQISQKIEAEDSTEDDEDAVTVDELTGAPLLKAKEAEKIVDYEAR